MFPRRYFFERSPWWDTGMHAGRLLLAAIFSMALGVAIALIPTFLQILIGAGLLLIGANLLMLAIAGFTARRCRTRGMAQAEWWLPWPW